MRPRAFRRQRLLRRSTLLLGAKLLVWGLAGLLLVQVTREFLAGQASTTDPASFEEAFQSVTELEQPTGNLPVSVAPSRYGITQSIYNSWRIRQRAPLQSITLISLDEVKAIYQSSWEQGQCGRYDPPLDIACLDSVISFGVEGGKRFLVGLPSDPRTAALEVVQRREAFRHQTTGSYTRIPAARRALTEGIQRDRALATLIESYSLAQQSELSFDLRRWLGLDGTTTPLDQATAEENRSGDRSTLPELTPDTIYAEAKPFTVEVWIQTNGISAPAAGILLSSNGLVLTNHHVVSTSFDFVRLADGQDLNGTLIASDPDLDLALIQLEGVSGLPIARLADGSSHIKVGDTVYAIGSPAGNHWQMSTSEIIQVQSDCGLDRLRCIRTPQGFLKPGNSGGPLLDRYGQVIGVNRAIQQQTGEGVSIPVETIRQYVQRYSAMPTR
ncbi:MAG: hypothetical protein Kow00121_47400 [Elainellaceae cyanobacterium]